MIKKNANDIFVLSRARLYISYNNGDDWEQKSHDSWGLGLSMVIDQENIFVGGLGSKEHPELCISNDYGEKWNRINDTLSGLKAQEIISIAANGNYVFTGSKVDGLFISRDKGETWEQSESIYFTGTPIYNFVYR